MVVPEKSNTTTSKLTSHETYIAQPIIDTAAKNKITVALEITSQTAAATKLHMPQYIAIHRIHMQKQPKPYYPDDLLLQEIMNVDMKFNLYEPSVNELLPLTGIHPTLGIQTEEDPKMTDTVKFVGCLPSGTIAHKNLKRWKSRLKLSVNSDNKAKQ
mmetsp:Transcript_12598/g.19385  ORF Transcript_12598/g.19385 Transcript_12598/m.19385 type:complete len:157 (-) Transcript_12598:1580-2050(-)